MSLSHPALTRRLVAATAVVLAVVCAGRMVAAEELKLELRDGRATLIARDVTVSAILEEWARVGHTNFVNADKVTGGAVTLHFEDAPEREVLDTLLRSVSGYMAAPRATPLSSASIYDRVLIMATSPRTASVRPRPTPRAPSGGRSPMVAPRVPNFPADADENAVELPGQEAQDGSQRFEPPTGPEVAGAPPYPTPAGQPLTPLLPGGAAGTPPNATNPFGLPAGVAATPGVIVQPEQPQQPGRTP